MPRFLISTALCLLVVNSALTSAQESKPPASFDVASIKPIQPYPAYPNLFIEINKLRGNHVTARMVVAAAYGVDRRQVIGGPGWIDSDRFNIDARAPNLLPPRTGAGLPEPVATMVRGLLTDRFRLRVRHETREMPVLALTFARVDRMTKGIRSAKVDCRTTQDQLARAPDDETKKAIFADCYERTAGEMHVRGRPIERLVDQLRGHLNRIVIDETGMSGNLDIDVKWEFATVRAQETARMLVALEEQIGLKVVERKAPVPVVVIERIQRPSPN